MATAGYESTQLSLVGNNVIRIDHPSLPSVPETYLTSSGAAAATVLTVRDNFGFANSDLILVGAFGDSRTEIKRINVAPNAGTTLGCTATTFAHVLNIPVRKILFDRIEVYGNSTASSTGSTLIATIDITPGADYTEYVVSGTTYDFYGVRPIRAAATAYNGTYSDFISASGFSTNTVGFVIQRAFEAVGEKIRAGGVFSKQWAYDQIFSGEQEVAKELKKWSWLQEYEYDMGNVTLGDNSYALPTNISDANTPKAIQGLRIGTGNNLTYISKAKYEYLFQNVAQTTLSTALVDTATTVGLTDSRDFATSVGAINIYSGGVVDNVSYVSNAKSTGILSGVTNINTGGDDNASPVWQNEAQGLPERYTVFESSLYFDTVPDNTIDLIGSNIWIDYHKNVTRADSDGDTLTVPDPSLIQAYLEAMIKKAKAGGSLDLTDPSYLEFLDKKKKLIRLETSGQSTNLVPDFFE